MDRDPALHPQGDGTPMPCHGEHVFDPKRVGFMHLRYDDAVNPLRRHPMKSVPMPCHGERPKRVSVTQEDRESWQKRCKPHSSSEGTFLDIPKRDTSYLAQKQKLPIPRIRNSSNPFPPEGIQRDDRKLGSETSMLCEPDTSMLRQPATRPISHDQLVAEVKGIYAGLVMVEAKCIEVDERQEVWAQNKDYASGQPASNVCSDSKPWISHIRNSSNSSRHHFLGSLEHMLAFIYIAYDMMAPLFIYIAYSMMALLLGTVPSFEDTWIEYLGDFGRYRMAIEEQEPTNRQVWADVARYWYCKAGDQSPETGRLYHHLEKRQLKLPGMGVVRTERIRSLKIRLSSISRCTRFGKKSNTRRIKLRADAPMVQYGQVLGTQEKPAGRAEETSSITGTAPIYGRHISPDSFPRDQSWKLERAKETSFMTSTAPIYGQHISHDSFPPDKSWKLERAEETSFITSTAPIYGRHISHDSFPPDEAWKLERHGDKPEKGGASHSSFPRLPLLNWMRRILTGAILLQVTMGMPTNSTALETSTRSHENFYVGLLYILSAGLFIGVAQLVSACRGPLPTHGIAMGVESLGWWLIANDDATSIGLRFIVLLLWTISTWQYFDAASAKLQLPRWATLGSIVLATGFDIYVVRTMTPSSVAVPQNDILTLSLPSVSLALGVTLTTFTVIQERQRRQAGDRPPSHSTGGDPSIHA